MSSHREAPEISKDPAADNTDVFAFVSPDAPSMVTLIANFNPFEIPYGGPNFSEFADSVVYGINVNNKDGANADIRYEFRFTTTIVNPTTFLYNVGRIDPNTYANWNRPQTYSVTKIVRQTNGTFQSTVLASGLKVPPCNVGPRSIADYTPFSQGAVHTLGNGKVFAGQRSDPFFVDLGSVFDLAGLRPFNAAHLIPLQNMPGVNGLQALNVHTIALQVPITELTSTGTKPAASAREAVIGVWANTTRARGRTYNSSTGRYDNFGEQVQVSRLAQPLFNEVLNPMAQKDLWNSYAPSGDSRYARNVLQPELAKLLPALYPGVFPNLGRYTKDRADLQAILLTGLPDLKTGPTAGFQNYTGSTLADMIRLNVGIAPTPFASAKPLGLIAGDPAGYPNGRRVFDETTTVELRAIAGLTIPLVDPSYTPDAAVGTIPATEPPNGGIGDGTTNTNLPYTQTFPYVAPPADGYDTRPGVPGIQGTNQNAG